MRVGADPAAAFQVVQRFYIFFPQFEIKDAEIFFDACAVDGFRNDDDTALDLSAENDLGRRAAVFFGEPGNNGITPKRSPPSKRAVSFRRNVA